MLHGPKASTRFLPYDSHLSMTDLATDQHGPLITAHDIQMAILGSATVAAESHEAQATAGHSPDGKAFDE